LALERAADPEPMRDLLSLPAPRDARALAARFDLRFTTSPERIGRDGSGAGTIVPVGTLGLSVAYFANDARRNLIVDKLGDDWVALPDTSFSLAPQEGIGPLVSRRRHRWPQLSGIQKAHAAGITGRGAFVGVLDSGVDADHAELILATIRFLHVTGRAGAGRSILREVRGFDTHGHGTLVSTVIAGALLGVAPGADLCVASVAEGDMLEAPLGKMMHGLSWITQQFAREGNRQAGILNVSLGFPGEAPNPAAKDTYRQSLYALRLRLAECRAKGLLPIAPMGNAGFGHCDYPASFPEVLAVGAVDMATRSAAFSGSTLEPPHCLGFGVNVPAGADRDYRGVSFYRDCSGTSFATAYVSGIAALYLSRDPDMSVDDLQAVLTRTYLGISNAAERLARFMLD
jgi:subtilisin family serine protease